jgi:hypothetical protein
MNCQTKKGGAWNLMSIFIEDFYNKLLIVNDL